MLHVNLLSGPVPVVLGVLGAIGLAVLVAGRGPRWWRCGLPVAVTATVVVTVTAVLLVERVWRPVPDPLPAGVIGWGAGAVLALVLVGARSWSAPRDGRRGPVRGAAVVGAAAVLVLLAAGSGVNLYFGQYPTIGALLGVPLPNQVDLPRANAPSPPVSAPPGQPVEQVWTPPAGLPAAGGVSQVSIPGTVSGFAARPGWVYLPPAYLTVPRAQLPVLVLLSGQPGSPRDWFDGGRLAERMDRYAAAHAGLAPVVVIPDHLGAPLAQPLCVDSHLGKVGTYLDVDVPAWIRRNLQVDPDPRAWAVGGYSEGGTCALQTALRAPQTYPSLIDISGQAEPSLGSRAATVRDVFGGDEPAFHAANPLDELGTRRYPGTAGMLVVGEQDGQYRPQAEQVRHALLAAGAAVKFQLVPGGHTWQVWGPGLELSLPWLGTRLGLTR